MIEGGRPAGNARFGMTIFLISEAMLFAGLIGAYIVLRGARADLWPPAGAPRIGLAWPMTPLNWITLGNTIVLIASSFLLVRAGRLLRRGQKAGLLWLAATVCAGMLFLVVQAWEWRHLFQQGLWLDRFGIYGSCFFVMTGFDGAHILVGLLLLICCLGRGLRGSPGLLENVSLYWHFVAVTWLCLYTLLYVI